MNGKNVTSKVEVKIFRGFMQKFTYYKYFHEITIFIGLIVISGIFSAVTPNFFALDNLFIILQQVSITTIVAFGLAIVIISGGIDLSVATVIVLIGYPIAKISMAGNGNIVFIILAIVAAIFTGGLIGFLNGINIVYLRIPAFIATLAMMQIARGLILTITQGTPIFGLPKSFVKIGAGFIGKVPVPVIIMFVIFIIFTYIMERTSFGRIIYAIGINEDATRLSGINVRITKLLIYIIGGACVGIASIIFTGRFGSVQPSSAETTAPLLFNSITAAILGGVSLSGGRGTMIGVMIGSIIVGVLHNGLALLNVDVHARSIIIGAVIIISILFSSIGSNSNMKK